MVSLLSRALYSHANHKICYSAVSSGGIVLILPGFAVSEFLSSCFLFLFLLVVRVPDVPRQLIESRFLPGKKQKVSAALELSNKTMMTGSLKLIWAIFQALFIGFVQTLGSDIWLRIDWTARAERRMMMNEITRTVYSKGALTANWTAANVEAEPIMFSVSHALDLNTDYPEYNFVGVGCYRGPDWPWYIQGLDWKWTLPLVPLFAFLLAVWNLQAMRRTADAKHVFIMVIFGCASYAGKFLKSFWSILLFLPTDFPIVTS